MEMIDFLTRHHADPPVIPLAGHLALLFALVGLAFLTVKMQGNVGYSRFFKALQWGQVLALYIWYVLVDFDGGISLPLYHCRLAMFALLLLPDRFSYKKYFAYMGLVGSVVSFAYPVLDTYAFPHLTHFSFIIGHAALFVNSLLYLLRKAPEDKLVFRELIFFVLGVHLLILEADLVTGGDYGFLRHLPILHSEQILFNTFLMSLLLIATMSLTDRTLTFLLNRSSQVQQDEEGV